MRTRPYQAGDYVRVVALPPEVDQYDSEIRDGLRGMLGRVLRVAEIDDQGTEPLHEINVHPDGSQAPDYGHDTVWLKFELVEPAEAPE